MIVACTPDNSVTGVELTPASRTVSNAVLDGMLWVRQFGSSGFDAARAVAAADGGVYVAGSVRGTLPDQTYSGGFADGFLRKYDADGNEQWTRQFGTFDTDHASAVAVDESGVYVAGEADASLTGGSSFNTDAFVRKYDANGNELWTRQFGVTFSSDRVNAIAVNAGGVYVFGATGGALPGQTHSGGFADVFLRKYDASGNEIWTRQFGTSHVDQAWSIAVNGNAVYVSGATGGTLDGQTSAGGFDGFVRKYDVNGNALWTRQFGTDSWFDPAAAIVADDAGVYVGGTTVGTLPGQTSAGDEDAYVRKYDHDGNEVWTRQFGSAQIDGVYSMAMDESGVYASGRTWGALAPGGGAQADAFVRKYDFDGNAISTRQVGTFAYDEPTGIALHGGALYLSGGTAGVFPTQSNAGANDAYLIRLSLASEIDATAPDVALSATPNALWPVNHKYQAIGVSLSASDAGDAALTIVATVVSSEADADGRGDPQAGDIKVTRADGSVSVSSIDNPIVTFNPQTDKLELRAERSPAGQGRAYTIRVSVTDDAGNETVKTVTVSVPHDSR